MVGIPAVGFIFMMSIMLFSERDSVHRARIFRAESDIRVIETAIGLYREKYGHYHKPISGLFADFTAAEAELLRVHPSLERVE